MQAAGDEWNLGYSFVVSCLRVGPDRILVDLDLMVAFPLLSFATLLQCLAASPWYGHREAK
jgi:hypothetical protein